ncbi:MAG: DUF1028 domain-containing protein [Chloroflexota bacterium]|nr:DUF1028 domain-containing protein [Chloroflexota bacterium]
MTFSIIARDPESASFGVAVCTAVPCVGALVPHAKSGVGAVATQSYVNVDLGRDGLKLLGLGMSPQAALEGLLADDPGAALRQVAAIDAQGRTFSYSGKECVEWFGSREGTDYSVQGNMLAGQAVVDAMADAFERAAGAPFSVRLLGALEAGQAAGGDKRGRQSAALLVTPAVVVRGAPSDFDPRAYALDIRVDEHPDPVPELRRIFELLRKQAAEEAAASEDR